MSRHTATLLLTLASAAMILSAWGFQMIGYPPCKMCFWQRYPHIAAIAIGSLALTTKQRLFHWCGAAALTLTGGIGVFHSGVERGLWEGPQDCTSTPIGGLNSDELFNQIMSAPLVRCDEISWQVLGLSMANVNAIFSLGLAAAWVWVALKRD